MVIDFQGIFKLRFACKVVGKKQQSIPEMVMTNGEIYPMGSNP